MKKDQQHAYHVKVKLIPQDKGYKSSFSQGIVFGKNPETAEKMAIENITEALKNEPIGVEIKIQSIVKLRKDFLFYPSNKNDKN